MKNILEVSNLVLVRYVKVTPKDINGVELKDMSFDGYIISDNYGSSFGTISNLISTPTMLEIIAEKHPSFYDEILLNGGFSFNGLWYGVDENGLIVSFKEEFSPL